ncbi:MAG: 50S ribosomal protein L18, partial [Thermodesulfobacteriota bacterium]|nr:50S ribosomal protein L18 [Thermodesulfobacteriota bacterium]
KELKGMLNSTRNLEAAREVGKLIGKKCKEKEISKIVFDRNGYLYHGRVKALADSVREAGLNY